MLHHNMKGTDTNAPPAPTTEDVMPTTLPMPNMPHVPGKVRLGLGLRSKYICTDEYATNSAKMRLKVAVGMATAI